MAGDWIKMRVALQRDPQVVRIWRYLGENQPAGLTDRMGRHLVVGALHALWTMAQDASADGELEGCVAEDIDVMLEIPGFGQALLDAQWLTETGSGGLVVPGWEKHNGQGAKRRASNQQRMKENRS